MEKIRKSKIIWHCRRGMLELDLLLTAVIDHQLDSMSEEHVVLFEKLLTYTDPELYAWLMGHEAAPQGEVATIVEYITSRS